jgi:hypothetical protein
VRFLLLFAPWPTRKAGSSSMLKRCIASPNRPLIPSHAIWESIYARSCWLIEAPIRPPSRCFSRSKPIRNSWVSAPRISFTCAPEDEVLLAAHYATYEAAIKGFSTTKELRAGRKELARVRPRPVPVGPTLNLRGGERGSGGTC